MDTPQVLLKHEVTGHTALFPATADLDTWHALGWQEVPAEDEGAEPSTADAAPDGDTDQDPAAEAAPNTPRGPAAKRATETKERA